MTDKLKELLIDRALLERLRSFCIDSSTYNLATDLLLAEPAVEAAEIEVVDVIGYFNPDNLARVKADEISGFMLHDEESERINTAAMTVAQHRRILAGVNQQAGCVVPEGWQIVPKQPTAEMINGAWNEPEAGHPNYIARAWAGAIKAAPLPPSPAAKAVLNE